MIDVPFAYAFTVGMVATVNPCGFPMLPAYLSFFLGLDDGTAEPGLRRVPRALAAAGAVSVGFLAVFGLLGVPIRLGADSLYRVMPWLTIVIGFVLAGIGVAMLLGRQVTPALPRLDRGGRTRGLASMALFGVSYAVASLGCTLPLFLTVVVNRSNAASSALTVLAYGLGMAVVLTAVTLAIALAEESLVGHLRSVMPYVHRIAGTFLVLTGGYLVWYWTSSLSRDASDTVGSGPVRVVDDWSSWAATELSDGGVELGLALAAAAVVVTAWAVLRRRPRPRAGDDVCAPPAPDPGVEGSQAATPTVASTR